MSCWGLFLHYPLTSQRLWYCPLPVIVHLAPVDVYCTCEWEHLALGGKARKVASPWDEEHGGGENVKKTPCETGQREPEDSCGAVRLACLLAPLLLRACPLWPWPCLALPGVPAWCVCVMAPANQEPIPRLASLYTAVGIMNSMAALTASQCTEMYTSFFGGPDSVERVDKSFPPDLRIYK